MTFDELWEKIENHQGEIITTVRGLEFSYEVRGGCIFISRKKKELTRASVNMAYEEAIKLDCKVKGPKKLKIFGASYLYPIFLYIGFIEV